jgi:hypothetical protein
MHSVAEVEPVWPQDEVAAHGVVDDEPCDEPRDDARSAGRRVPGGGDTVVG